MQPGIIAMVAAILFSVGFLLWFLVGLAIENRQRLAQKKNSVRPSRQPAKRELTVRYYLGNLAAGAIHKDA
jgi:cell division protein FtsB